MLNRIKTLGVCMCVISLTGCATYDATNQPLVQQPYSYEDTPLYPEGYDAHVYSTSYDKKSNVTVPETYHVGPLHAPTPHSDRDKSWVQSQNAQGYTIELTDNEKASQVAKTLFLAPKKERTAEVKYQKYGQIHYKGLYGTYPNYEAAEAALQGLPEDIKQQAGIKTWGTVQQSLGD